MTFLRVNLVALAIVICSMSAAAQSDMRVLKLGPGTAVAGNNVTYTITVDNDGPNSAAAVTLSDVIPADLTFVSLTPTAGAGIFTCMTPSVGTNGSINCSAAPFANGANVQFSLVVNVPANTPVGTAFNNTAVVSVTEGVDNNSNNNMSSSMFSTVAAEQSDLRAMKTGPDSAVADSDVTFTIDVFNDGPADTPATLTEQIPAGMTFVSLGVNTGAGVFSCTPPAVGDGGSFTCTAASFPANTTVQFSLVLHIPSGTQPGTTFTNVATITSTGALDPNEENNTGTWSVTTAGSELADLGANKSTASDRALANSDVTYTLVVTNGGPTAADMVTITDVLPNDMTFVSMVQNNGPSFLCTTPGPMDPQVVTCTLASMPANTSATFTLTGHIPPGAEEGTLYTNTFNVGSATPDPNSENNNSQAVVTVATPVDLSVQKTGPGTVNAGENITWVLTVTNLSPATATNVSLQDQLPANTTFQSINQDSGPMGACVTPNVGQGGLVTCNILSFPTGMAQFTLVAKVGNTPSVTNIATVASENVDPNTDNNTASVTTGVSPRSDISVAKTDSPDPVNAGSNITYTVTIENLGPTDAQTVSLTDPVPVNTTFVSGTQVSGPTFTCAYPSVGGTGIVNCQIATFIAGASATFQIVVRVNDGTPNVLINNTATATSATVDPNSENNEATATTQVQPIPDLTISKTHAGNFTAGQPGSYTITVSNVGGAPTVGTVTVTDTVPLGLTLTGPAGSHNGWFCTVNGQTLTCVRNDSLAAGSSYPTITLTVNVINPAPLTVTNTATVSGGGESNLANNSASDTTQINCTQDPALTNTNPLKISRFRSNGPNGPLDEFVEIYNPGTTDYVVASGNCTGGLSVIASAGNGTTSNGTMQVCQIPNGTLIPAGGYYLCTGTTYSLNNLGLNGGPTGATAVGDTSIGCDGSCAGDIPNDAGLALADVGANIVTLCAKGSLGCPSGFNYSSPAGAGNALIYDSVGFGPYGPGAPAPAYPSLAGNFCEGPCLQPVGDASTSPTCTNTTGLFPVVGMPPACYGQAGQYEVLRRQTTFDASLGTVHQDGNNNADDFILVAPNSAINMGLQVTGISGVTSVLGASVPQNSTAPPDMPRVNFTQAPFDAGEQLGPRNAERSYASDPTIANPNNDPLGTFILRLRFTNNSGRPITPIRFRVDNLSTLCGPQNAAPAVGSGNARNLAATANCGGAGLTAILKLVNSTTETVVDSGGVSRDVLGTVMEDLSVGGPPAAGPLSPFGGGVDNTLIINPSTDNASVGDGVTGGTGIFNVVAFSGSPANVMRLRIKFGVVKSGRFILLITPQAKLGPTPLPG